MSGWVVPSRTGSAGIQLPPSLQIATTGSRLGAWFLDRVFFLFLAVLLAGIALVVGVVDISPAANDQILAGKSANLVTVPLLTVNTGLLVAFGAVWVLIQYAYEAVSWALLRGTPGQRILSLWVADAATGRNLTMWRSTLRWLVLESVPQIALAVFVVLFVRMMGEVPPSVYGPGATSASLAANGTYATVSLAGDLAALISVGWRLAHLFITASHVTRRGLHDRMAGSVVVSRASAASYLAHSAYGGPDWTGGPIGAGQSFGPGNPYGQPAAPGQLPAPSGFEVPPPVGPIAPPLSGPHPEPSGQEAERPEPGEQPAATQDRDVESPDSWPPPSSRWAPPGSGWNRPSAGGSRQIRDPNWTRRSSEDSMPRAHRLADGTELPVGLRVPAMARRLTTYLIDCLIVYFFYSAWLGLVVCWRIWRGTVGQRVLKLQIGNVETGEALSWGDAFVRWCILQGPFALATVVPVVLYPVLVFGAAGWSAFLLYDAHHKPDHRAVHDRAVNSLVAQSI